MPKQINLLIVDDDKLIRNLLEKELQNFKVQTAANLLESISAIDENTFECVLLDLKLPDGNGLEILKYIKEKQPFTQVIVITAYGTIETAISAMKLGAYDYLTKPFSLNEIEILIEKAAEKSLLERENIAFKIQKEILSYQEGIIGESNLWQEVLNLSQKVAITDSPVLITGESGVGKELIANFIHKNSSRKDSPLISLDCGTLQSNLLESELFGYEKGAFSNAVNRKLGLLEVASNGTLFLDEIANTNYEVQGKLLRVLETGEVRRLGSNSTIKINVRLIAASNQDLKQQIKKGLFREDLYFRLNVFNICVPPLRERKEDIPLLINYFLKKFNTQYRKEIRITNEAINLIKNYNFPGNVRELKNLIERLVVISEKNRLEAADIKNILYLEKSHNLREELNPIYPLEEIEKKYILKVLDAVDGNKTKAAEILKIDVKTLRKKIQE